MEATAATIDMHPMWVDLEPAMQMLEGYEQAEDDRKVYACIASYANSQGIAWPTYRNIVHKTGLALQRVKRSAWRLSFKNLLAIPRKEKKNNDIHPRNIYQINKDFLRQDPDMRSSHFDAEKWKPFAARLKKYVSKAVDKVKQVAVAAAENMASAARKPKKQRKQRQNGTYQHSSNRPYYSYENMRAAYPPADTGEKEPDGPGPLERRVMDSLFDLGLEPWGDAFQKAGHYMLDRLPNEPSDEEYDAMFQEAVGKFHLPNHVSQPNRQSHSSHVRDVRVMSSDDEPKTLGSILGGAVA